MRRFLVTFAASALIMAGAAVGVAGSVPAASAAPAPHRASGAHLDTLLSGAQQLLQYVPADARGACYMVDPVDLNADLTHVLGAVRCESGTDHVASVVYLLEPDAQNTDQDIASIGSQATNDSPTDECPVTKPWSYGDDTGGGIETCGEIDGATQIVWSADDQNIVGLTRSLENDTTALNDWFNNDSGPTQTADDSVQFASAARSDRVAAAKQLVQQTGDSTHCRQLDADVSNLKSGSLGWEWLPWLDSSVSCAAPKHQGPVEFFHLASDSASTFQSSLVDNTVGDTKPTKHSSFCADGVYHAIHDKKNQHIGQIQCFYVGGVLWASWYLDKGPAAGTVGAMPADNFSSPTKFFAFLSSTSVI